MSTVAELERAIESLEPQDWTALRDWFFERDAAAWDKKFAADATSGKLDQLGEKA